MEKENSMRQYLENFVSRKYSVVCEELQAHAAEGKSLCFLQDSSFTVGCQPDYSNRLFRNVYLLRYGVAYFTEYFRIYEKIFSQMSNNSGRYSILSVGCGAHLDKVAASFALHACQPSAQLKYIGLDRVNWSDDIEQSIINNYSEEELTDLPQEITSTVLAFPKSISELDKDFLLDVISRVRSEQILVVFSLRKGDAPSFDDCYKINYSIQYFLEHEYFISHANCLVLEDETIFKNLGFSPFLNQNDAFTIVANLGKHCCKHADCIKPCGDGLSRYPMTRPQYFWDSYYFLEKINAPFTTTNLDNVRRA